MSKNTSQTLARLDRALTREQLRRSEALLRAIAESSPLAILVIDDAAEQVLYFNHLLLEVLRLEHLEERLLTYGVTVSELIQECPDALSVQRSRPPPLPSGDSTVLESAADVVRVQAGGGIGQIRLPAEKTIEEIVLADGRALRRVTTAVRDRSGRDVGLLIALEEITAERLARENERKRTERVLAFQAALLELAEMDKGDLGVSLRTILEVDGRVLDASRVSYWALSEDRDSATCNLAYDVGSGAHHDSERAGAPIERLFRGDAPRYLELVLGSKAIAVNEIEHDERISELRAVLMERGVRSLLDVPVWCEARVVGFIRHERTAAGAATGEASPFNPDEQEFASSVAEMASVALEASARHTAERALKKLQEQLVLTDRMASVGTLAAGVAHEINNPLAFVIANLSYVRETLDPHRDRLEQHGVDLAEVEQALAEALEGADRVKRIVQSLRSFSKADGGDWRLVDVRNILDLSIRMTSNEIAQRAKLQKHYEAVPLVYASEAELGQVFLNILLNAAQSIEERIARAAGESAPPGAITIRSCRGDGGEAVVEIRDNGAGMSEDQLKRAFDPFFTTKPVGTGTGLGLFVSRNILLNVGGDLSIESAPGQGCLVRIRIPASDSPTALRPVPALRRARQPASASGGEASKAPETKRRARVIVIDDEPTIGTVIERMLRSEHEVVVISDGFEALERLSAGEPVDVILCDLLMPGLTGMDLYERLGSTKPELAKRMLFFTGGAFTPRAEAFLESDGRRCIEKPFDATELRAAVRSML